MARELNGPLTEEDLSYLRERYPEPVVQRRIELLGLAGDQDEPENGENGGENGPEGSPDPEGQDTPREAENGPENDEEGEEDDDLIGETVGNAVVTTFDPTQHTVQEVKNYLDGASAEEANAVKLVEKERTDREPRSSVLNYG